jgi:hypothetical protein
MYLLWAQQAGVLGGGGGGGNGINVKNYTSTANSNIFEIGYDVYFISNTTNTEGGYVYLDTGNVSITISKGQCITIGKKILILLAIMSRHNRRRHAE